MLMLIRGLLVMIAKGIAALALGGTILWQVVEHCGPAKGVAYVHVGKSEVNVTVDNETYWVEKQWDTAIVCELRPGRHVLRMLQSGRVLFEQEFRLDSGQEVVLIAWEEFNEKRDGVRPSSTSFNALLSPSQLARRNP
jgi:hypothetical protein